MDKISLYGYGNLLLAMSKNELKSRYNGNYGGVLWAFVQPSVTIGIFWFVFSVGFKSAPVNDVAFILWLVAGMVPWFFFSEAVSLATHSVVESSFLVKKIVFEVSLLPLVKIVSAFVVHLFFVFMVMGMYVLYGHSPSVYWVQVLYYMISSLVLVVGISLFSSSVIVFFKDMGQLVGMGVQFGFWLTPIFWSLSMLPMEYHWIFKLNPMYYITQGFRECFIGEVWFWEKPMESAVFWCFNIVILGVGVVMFRKLRPHFADVL